MSKKEVSTEHAPRAIGPYSQGVCAGSMVFVSGQIPVNPQTGSIAEGVAAQAEQALNNVGAVLEAAGASCADVVKTTVFLKDMGGFAQVNEVYARFFTAPYPARACVEVARLPKDVLVEVEAIAVVNQ